MADNPYAKYATPTGRGVVIRDPYREAEEGRKSQDQANEGVRLNYEAERLRIAREEAARNAAKDAADIEEKAAKAEERAAVVRAQQSGISDSLNQMRGVIAAAKQAKLMGSSGDGIGSLEGSEGFKNSILMSTIGANGASLDMEALLNTIGSNTAFDRLQKMRDESPTGGALGAVSEIELKLLRDSIASLSQRQSEKQFADNLDKVIKAYERVAGKLQSADRYWRENGSMDGYTPPTEDELAAMAVTGDGGVPPPAGGGATEGSKPIPPEMQAAHATYLAQNWGNLSPEGYAAFRADLDRQYGFEPDLAAYRGVVGDLNARAAQGGAPDGLEIPSVNVDLSASEQATNDFVNTAAGRLTTAYANAAGVGIPGLFAGDQLAAMREESNGEMFAGDLLGGFTGAGLVGGALRGGSRFLAGRAPGAAQRLSTPLAAEIGYGAGYGAAEADDPLLGAVMGLGGAVGGDLIGQQIAKRAPAVVGAFRPSDTLSRGERAIASVAPDIDPVVAALNQAGDLGVPMTLADASPELGSLAGSATRFSPTTAGTAREVMARRNQGQVDRLAAAVERDLGPVTNIPQRSEELIAQARAAAGPLYDEAYAAPGVEDLQIADLLSRPSMTRALPKARNIVLEEGGNPDELGLVLNEAGDVVLSDAGRFTEARGPRPSGGGSVISGAGNRAPDDLVTFVRANGGVQDQGGELTFLDLDNKPRTGVRMAGGEAGRGRLVNNDSGRSFDEMAEAAWEAGYFGPPETTPRPTTTDFLMALEDTHLGTNRVFSVYDDDVVSRFNAAEENVAAWRNAEGEMVDNAAPIGMDELPTTPLDAYGSVQPVSPTWQTLDYVKRGLDDVLEGYRDPTTGRLVLDTEGNAVNATLQDFKGRLDTANPAYGAARAAYAGPVAERGFLRQGQDAIRTRPDELGVQMGNLSPEQAAQMRLGYQSELMGRANDVRSNGNPWAQLNTPNTEGRLGVLYEGAEDADVARLLSQRDLELQLAGSANRLIGNSATAERSIADEFFKQTPGIGGDVAQGVAETALLGGPFLTVGKRVGDRLFRERRERAAMEANRSLADELGPILLNDVPADAAVNLADINTRAQEYGRMIEELLLEAQVRGARFGGVAGAILPSQFTRPE